jgi:hypothetical protein
MKMLINFKKYVLVLFCTIALCIVAYVLLQYPRPGVADQGDFDRVMFVSGLKLTEQNKNDPDFNRFLNYVVTDYKISNYSLLRLIITLFSTSLGYLITIISFICKIFGQDIFKTGYLAAAYSAFYIFSIYMIIKYINLKNKAALIMLALLSLLIFFDGNYLLWFNSLYGEPMMLTTLLLYISSVLYYFHHKNVLKSRKKLFPSILFTFIAAYLFLGSKMQVISALPAILVMQIKLLWENRKLLSLGKLIMGYLLLFILIFYPLEMNIINGTICKDTQYNSVFYGVLKDSKNPQQDLIDMGLNPALAVEAGKHSYLDSSEYVKYIPRTEITKKEFYNKMSNGKLIKFYLTHPVRLIQGMEYTAGKAFITSTTLGKYERSYSEEPVIEFNRFTLWSSFRESLFPKKFIFIVFTALIIFAVSMTTYMKNKNRGEIKDKIYLLWMIMFIGLIQFPMPYLGNGQADTAKQLYLFNFVFDIMLLVSACWCFDTLAKQFYKRTF